MTTEITTAANVINSIVECATQALHNASDRFVTNQSNIKTITESAAAFNEAAAKIDGIPDINIKKLLVSAIVEDVERIHAACDLMEVNVGYIREKLEEILPLKGLPPLLSEDPAKSAAATSKPAAAPAPTEPALASESAPALASTEPASVPLSALASTQSHRSLCCEYKWKDNVRATLYFIRKEGAKRYTLNTNWHMGLVMHGSWSDTFIYTNHDGKKRIVIVDFDMVTGKPDYAKFCMFGDDGMPIYDGSTSTFK